MDHLYLLPIDPKGTEGRRSQCQHCKAIGTWAQLRAVPCSAPASETNEERVIAAITGEPVPR